MCGSTAAKIMGGQAGDVINPARLLVKNRGNTSDNPLQKKGDNF